MKKYLVLLMVLLLPVATMQGKKKEKQNIMVWGEVSTAQDGKDYLTMYKNCPAQVTAQFHFLYTDKTKSVMYDLVMPDTVAQVLDPMPVEKPVKEVVVDNIIYSTVDAEGKRYSTSDPDDPVLAMLLVDLFDFYHDIFWFDAVHRARYYNNRTYNDWTPGSSRYSRANPGKSKAPELDLDKLDDTALLIGAAAVAVASAGMLVAVIDNWDEPDDRFPYFSLPVCDKRQHDVENDQTAEDDRLLEAMRRQKANEFAYGGVRPEIPFGPGAHADRAHLDAPCEQPAAEDVIVRR